MKQKTKHLSILLAFSLILGSIPGTNASAAKKVNITKKVSVTAGKTTKIKLKNNKKKVTWKVTKGKNIVKITKKTKSYATIKGVKKGSAKVQATIGKNKYSCTVTVKAKMAVKTTPKPTTKTTVKPTAAPTGNPPTTPTETPGQIVDGVLQLYYNNENAGKVIKQIRDSEIPVHVIVEDSVTSLRSYAFRNCSKLTSITIGNGVTTIDIGVFQGCSGLTSITIGTSVTVINMTAFYDCSGLTSITVAEGNNVMDSRGNCNAIIDTKSNTLAFGCKNTEIPNTVTNIAEGAFSLCSGPPSITIPDSVTRIDGNAFSYNELTSITVAEGNNTYDSRGNCNAIIETDTNTLITGCKNTTIPDSVTRIGKRAFSGCSGLTSITIPDGVVRIDDYAFSGCSGLTSITVAEGNRRYDSRGNCNAIIETDTNTLITGCKNTTIPDSVTSIGDRAFSGCSGLTSITIPGSVTSIEDSAFSDCSGLTSIEIPDGVTSIGDYAFSGCSSLTSITIPDSVTSIDDTYYMDVEQHSVFWGCRALTSITWKGNTYTSVGEFINAFREH